MSALVVGDGLSFAYAEPLFAGVDLEVDRGRCWALLGSNGAGKTTLLRLLSGLRPPHSGTVLLDGVPLPSLPAADRARRIGILPQGTPSAEGFAACELVLMGLYANMPARGWEGPREWRAVVRALRSVGAGHLVRRPFDELSGGEQRRVLLARALVSNPDVLILDEPLASLDPGFAMEMAALLESVKRAGTAMIVATHDLRLASQIADGVLLMRRGETAVAGSAREMLVGERLNATYGTSVFSDSTAFGGGAGL